MKIRMELAKPVTQLSLDAHHADITGNMIMSIVTNAILNQALLEKLSIQRTMNASIFLQLPLKMKVLLNAKNQSMIDYSLNVLEFIQEQHNVPPDKFLIRMVLVPLLVLEMGIL